MGLKLLMLALVVGVAVSAGPTIISRGETGRLTEKLGTNQCTFGPSYWCDHIRKSAECGMTSWCIANVWQHMDLPDDIDNICSICLDMVQQARDQLNSNETQEELKEVLEGSCNLIPIHVIADECVTLVDDFIPELIEVLTSEMNPQVVCQTAGLCNSPRIDSMLEDRQNTLSATPADTCDTCKQKTELMKHHIAAGGQYQLLDTLLLLCRDLGSYSDACAADLATHIGDIYSWLQHVNSEEVCLVGDLCPGLYTDQPTQLDVAGPAIDCDLCIHVVKRWRDILVSNTTKEEFKEILDGICSKAGDWASKCTQLVDEYYLVIYNYLINDLKPHAICKAVGLCASSDAQPPLMLTVPAGSPAAAILRAPALLPMTPLDDAEVPLTLLTPAEKPVVPEVVPHHQLHTVALKKAHVQAMKEHQTLHHVNLEKTPPRSYGNDALAFPNPLDVGWTAPPHLPLARMHLAAASELFQQNTELCDLCEFGLRELQKVLMQDDTEDEITTKVGALCDLLPSTLESRCHQFVLQYGDFVITLLAQEIDPTEVCPALHLCPWPSSESELGPDSAPVEMLLPQRHVQEPPGCAMCEYAMTRLLRELQDKSTEREIRDALDHLCGLLPRTVAHECEELVNTFTENFIDMVVSGLTADEICIAIELCTDGAAPLYNDIESNSIHAVPASRLGDDFRHPLLRFAGLSARLDGLPVNSPLQPGQPEVMMTSSEAEFDDDAGLNMLTRVKRPFVMESDGSSSEEEDEEEAEFVSGGQSPVCVLCEFILTQLKAQLNDSSTDADIEDVVKRACSYLPRSVRQDCDAFINNYGPALLDAIKQALDDPDAVCVDMELCAAPAAGARDVSRLLDSVSPSLLNTDSSLFETGSCDDCQQVVGYAARLLADGRSVSSRQLCFAVLPNTRLDQCVVIVHAFAPYVRNQLTAEEMITPLDVCMGIDLCPRPAGSVHLLGGELLCSAGPLYACRDYQHARACQALPFCFTWWDRQNAERGESGEEE